jgi:hypothetical protein
MVKDLGFVIKRSKSRLPHEMISLTFRCKKCKGEKVVKDKKRVEFQIEPGTENGERIALKGEGDEIVRPQPCCKQSYTHPLARHTSRRRHFPYSTPSTFYIQTPHPSGWAINNSQNPPFRIPIRFQSSLFPSSRWEGNTYRSQKGRTSDTA